MRLLIHNQKGGVGKTTTTANLGAALLRAGIARHVLVADLDPQMHLTAMLGHQGTTPGWTLADWLTGRPGTPLPIAGEPGLALVPGCSEVVPPFAPPALIGGQSAVQPSVDQHPANTQPADTQPADWTLIDSAPAWSDHMAVLGHWADLILCPLEPDFLGLSGVSRLLMQLDAAGIPRARLRFVPCRVNPRLAVHRDVIARLSTRLGADMVLPAMIRTSVRLSEAPGFGQTIFRHAPGSTGCHDHLALARCLADSARPTQSATTTTPIRERVAR
jgi:chromosome partitioning protein